MKRTLSLILAAVMVLGLLGCGNKKDGEEEKKLNTVATDADIAQLEALYEGRDAYHGNLHDHSDSGGTTDGKFPLSMWPNFLGDQDLDFAALVDHRQSLHMRMDAWDTTMFMGATETGHRRLDTNNEIDAIHYNILMNDPDAFEEVLASFDAFNYTGDGYFKVDSNQPFTEDEFSQMVEMVKEKNGIVVHVHPCWEGYMSSEDPMDYVLGEYTGLEILCSYGDNNMSYEPNKDAYDLWVELLNMGQHIYAFAGSDSHKQTQTMSASTVYAEERLNDSYLKHIVKGDFTAGPVGIRMSIGDAVMGGHTDFTGKRLVLSVSDFQSQEFRANHQYRLDVYDENGLVFSEEFDSSAPAYFAIDATDCKYYRADVYDVTSDYILAVGNPIWNEP